MATTGVNYLAVLVAGAIYFMLGAVWYAKGLFGKAWMEGIGKTEEKVKADYTPMTLVWAFVGSFVSAYGIARVLSWTTGTGITGGVTVGLIAAVCFAIPPLAVGDCMESRPLKLTIINGLYDLIGFLIMGIIIGVWR